MSRDNEEAEAVPPRNPRPRATRQPLAEGDETYRKATQRATTSVKKAKRKGDSPKAVAEKPNLLERIMYGSVSSGQLATFCGQFSRYQEAGVDVLRALKSLGSQFAPTALGPVIARLERAVRGGESLASAMEREPQAFDKLTLSMMRVAEARGGEPETLRALSKHYEARQRMIRQARSAMIYPTIVLLIAVTVIMLVTIFVIPKMVEFIADFQRGKPNVDLPGPTMVLMAISNYMRGVGWWLTPTLFVASIIGVRWLYSTKPGKNVIDLISLQLPVLGKLRAKIETTRFARTLAVLTNAGVDINASLALTTEVMNLTPFRRAVAGIQREVLHGSELSEATEASRRFTSDVVAIIGSGEETGKLPESLDKLADDYEEQVEYLIKNLGNLIQPILMVVLGGMVLFIILGVILAYLQMLQAAAM